MLGGDSLRAVQIVLRLNEELEAEVPINALFETRTVYGLAAMLAGDSAPVPQPVPIGGGSRLSAAQWRLWLHQRSAPHSTADNAPVVVRLPGPLDLAALAVGADGLLDRNAILRTRYERDGSGSRPRSCCRRHRVGHGGNGDPRAVLAANWPGPSISPRSHRCGSAWCAGTLRTTACCSWSCTASRPTTGPVS